MQSLFTGEPVDFTLEGHGRITGRVMTMHNHKIEDPILEKPAYYGVEEGEAFPSMDWLIVFESIPTIPSDFHQAYIEFRELNRSGVCVLQTREQLNALLDAGQGFEHYYMPAIWQRMMGIDAE